jgi:hypothetical protein
MAIQDFCNSNSFVNDYAKKSSGSGIAWLVGRSLGGSA